MSKQERLLDAVVFAFGDCARIARNAPAKDQALITIGKITSAMGCVLILHRDSEFNHIPDGDLKDWLLNEMQKLSLGGDIALAEMQKELSR